MAGKGGGGAWKVAYADFVTAMMAFFLVMWITAQNKPVKEAVANYFENPLGATETSGSTKPPSGKPGPPAPPPKLRMFQKADKTHSVGTMVLFPEGSAELDEAARTQLGALVPQLLGKPHKVEIRGHTLPLVAREDANEWELSFSRCLRTMQFLTQHGIEAERIRLSQAGSTELYSRRTEPEWRELNARVEVFALNELTQEYEASGEERTGTFSTPADEPAKKPAKAAAHGHGAH